MMRKRTNGYVKDGAHPNFISAIPDCIDFGHLYLPNSTIDYLLVVYTQKRELFILYP